MMGRKPCCEKVGLKRGPWAAEEDKKLVTFINTHGISCRRAVPKLAGLLRCGKSCRLRWTNYLRPDLKRGIFTEAEENVILELHVRHPWQPLPGRTDNEIKNYWHTRLTKRLRSMGLDPNTHKPVGNSRTEVATDQTVENSSSSPDPRSHYINSQRHTPTSQGSAEVPGRGGPQLQPTFQGPTEPGGDHITTPKPDPICVNPKQSSSGLQSSSSDVDTNLRQALSRNHLENNYHIPGVHYTESQDHGPKFEVLEVDPFMLFDLHPHARHLRQEKSCLNIYTAREHEVPSATGAVSEERSASGGIFQELAGNSTGARNLLNRQTSGYGNWSFLGELHVMDQPAIIFLPG